MKKKKRQVLTRVYDGCTGYVFSAVYNNEIKFNIIISSYTIMRSVEKRFFFQAPLLNIGMCTYL